MKKTSIFIMWLIIQITALFIAAIGVSFLTEWIETTGFFGDTIYDSGGSKWGIRHFLYQAFIIIMLGISILRIGAWADWYWEDKKK